MTYEEIRDLLKTVDTDLLYGELFRRSRDYNSDVLDCTIWMREDVEDMTKDAETVQRIMDNRKWIGDRITEEGWEVIASYI